MSRTSTATRPTPVPDVVPDPVVPVAPAGPVIEVLPSGPRNARTDPETGLRFYTWEGRELPSVTTVRRMAGVPTKLHEWTLTQAINHVISNIDSFTERRWAGFTPSTTEAELREQQRGADAVIRHEIRAASTEKRDRAGALGTAVHLAAAAGKLPEDVDAEIAPRLRQYRDWLRVSGAVELGSEFQVFNLTEGYAGSVDSLVQMRDGSIWLVDTKTGGDLYIDHVLQVCAYLRAEFVGLDDKIDTGLTALLHQTAGMALLHLSDTSWEFLRFEPTEELWEAFRGLLRFAVFAHVNDKPERLSTGRRKGSAPDPQLTLEVAS